MNSCCEIVGMSAEGPGDDDDDDDDEDDGIYILFGVGDVDEPGHSGDGGMMMMGMVGVNL